MAHPSNVEEILALERSRCQALADGDVAKLRELLADDLQHIHADGTAQDRDAYLAHLGRSVERHTERRDLVVRLYGPVAVVTGGLVTTIRRAHGEPLRQITGVAIQVWADDGAGWKQVVFQVTATGPVIDLDG